MPRFEIITTQPLRNAIRNIERAVDERARYTRRLIGTEVVETLRNPAFSHVNVDTGRMQRSYAYKVDSVGSSIEILNSAKSPTGFPYPVKIERDYGGATTTVRLNKTRIVRNVNRRLKHSRQPGRFRYEVA